MDKYWLLVHAMAQTNHNRRLDTPPFNVVASLTRALLVSSACSTEKESLLFQTDGLAGWPDSQQWHINGLTNGWSRHHQQSRDETRIDN